MVADCSRNQHDPSAGGGPAFAVLRLSRLQPPKQRLDQPVPRDDVVPRPGARTRDVARESTGARHELHPADDRFGSVCADEAAEELVLAADRLRPRQVPVQRGDLVDPAD